MKRFIILCLAVGTMAACNGSKEAKETKVEATTPVTPDKPDAPKTEAVAPATTNMKDAPMSAAKAPAWVFTMERTPCFGKCPWDSFSVRADGTILYEGKRDVERIGVFTGVVDVERAAAVRTELDELGYFNWEAEYDNDISDLPSLKLRYMAKDGFTKEVSIRGEAPTGTEHLRNVMLGLYESVSNWEKVEAPEVPHNE
ncbi:MAG: hypothetical protein J4F31_12300 [Flavobacteriales bacterium]|nr:hypothetical protein [Flavobacteriales bacterium]